MPEEKLEESFKLELVENVPEHLKDKFKPGDMAVKARSLHKIFLEEPWQSELAKDSLNFISDVPGFLASIKSSILDLKPVAVPLDVLP